MSASPGFALSAVRRCVASALRAVNDEGTNTIAMLLSDVSQQGHLMLVVLL